MNCQYKYFLPTAFLICCLLFFDGDLNAQENTGKINQLKFGLGKVFFTAGDYDGIYFSSQYNRKVSSRFEINGEMNMAYGSDQPIPLGDSTYWKYPFSFISKENPEAPFILTPGYDLVGENAYLKKYPTHLNKQINIGADAGVSYYLLDKRKSKLKASIGVSLNYVDLTYDIGPAEGMFTDEATGITSAVTIHIPLYDRYLEGRWFFKFDYDYMLTDSFSLGLRSGGYFYFDEFLAEMWLMSLNAGARF